MSEEEAVQLKQSSCEQILQTALQRVHSWMPAVQRLLAATLPAEVWATPLYDRDAMDVTAIHSNHNTQTRQAVGRVTVLGDACHPMSMFKGQGANQALEDGPRLVQALVDAVRRDRAKRAKDPSGGTQATRKRKAGGEAVDAEDCKERQGQEDREAVDASSSSSSSSLELPVQTPPRLGDMPVRCLHSVLRRFEREMVARTSKKVLASRLAAQLLHSPRVFDDIPRTEILREEGGEEGGEEERESEDAMWRIAGVKRQEYARLVRLLREKKITAATCPAHLEERLVEQVVLMRSTEKRAEREGEEEGEVDS